MLVTCAEERESSVTLGVVHNCQHLCISTESTRGEGGPRPAYYF